MNFRSLLFLAVLYLGTTLGAPSHHAPRSKTHHQRFQRGSKPLQKFEPASLSHLKLADTLTSEIHGTYSSNWAGAVLENPPPSASYTYVSATITVPTPTPTPTNNTTYQAASAWVGIDGDTYTTAILQTGVDFYVIDGEPYTDAWYEWYPNTAMYYDEFAVNPGDIIVASVNVMAPNRGVCMVENRSTGETVSKTVSAPKSTATVVGWNAEWVVEDFESAGESVAFVAFDQVCFEGCAAYADGVAYGLRNATVYELVQDGMVVAGVSIGNGDEEEMVVMRYGCDDGGC
jgi:Peptidase A4 family.